MKRDANILQPTVDAKGKPTRNQAVLVQRGWPLKFVRTPEEALRAVGAR